MIAAVVLCGNAYGLSYSPQSPEGQSVPALDYTVPVGEIVNFLGSLRSEMTDMSTVWARGVNDEIRNIHRSQAAMAEMEKELEARYNSYWGKYTQDVIDLFIMLDAERAKAASLKNDMAISQLKIVTELQGMEKLHAKIYNEQFKNTMKNVTPTTPYASASTTASEIFFAPMPELAELPSYLAPLNELIVWYWNAERIFGELVLPYNARIEACMAQDEALRENQDKLQAELDQYTDPKTYKAEISNLKKQISQVEKERKAISKNMANDSKELSGKLKTLNAELLGAFNERLYHVIDEMHYILAERGIN